MDDARPRSTSNRRRFPRLQVLGSVEGHLIPLDVPMTVIELSQGGFSVRSATPFPPGSRQHFRFTTARGDKVTLDATAVHCRLAEADDVANLAYVSGFEFCSTPKTDQAVALLIDTLASVFSLE